MFPGFTILRCTLVETTDLGSMVESEVDPHTFVSGVETTAEMATRGLSE